MNFLGFSDEQRRTLLNLAQYYAAHIEAERTLIQLGRRPLIWKTVKGRDYLYELTDSAGNAKSRGPRSPETEQQYTAWQNAKANQAGVKALLAETGRLYRALRLGTISTDAAAILREADARNLLGSSIIVVGTNAMPAYEIEAQSRFGAGLDETMDCDLAWVGGLEIVGTLAVPQTLAPAANPIWDMLKAVDATYTVNTERPFQARNTKAYEVELLVAPSRVASLTKGDRPVPMHLPEMEWLLKGKFVDHIVCARDGTPARIVAPDPRWFALHKLWMSEQAKRNPLKRPKDKKQGERLLAVTRELMPHYPLDKTFTAQLPAELKPYL